MERVKEVLKKVLPEAESRGVKLGAENRQGLEELPLDSDFKFLFKDLASPGLVYWHDTGHAQIKENLGFLPQLMQLETMRDRLCGFHIHDVQFPGRDHCAPGSGTIDFASLKAFPQPEHIKVLELSPGLKPEEVRRGFDHVRSHWGGE